MTYVAQNIYRCRSVYCDLTNWKCFRRKLSRSQQVMI